MNSFFKTNYTTNKNWKLPDYQIYNLSKKEYLLYGFSGFALAFLILYFFYDSLIVIIPAILIGIAYCQYKKKDLLEQRRKKLEMQFKDWMNGVMSKLQAGYSVENAFVQAGEELQYLYATEELIQKEVVEMKHLLANNITLEQILSNLGIRSGSDVIIHFADVFSVGKRSGGNIREMMEACCEIIVMRIRAEKEIQILLHGKYVEQRVMSCVPFAVITYIKITSPGYFDPLYHNLFGICVMTICLFLYIFSIFLSKKIIKIEV